MCVCVCVAGTHFCSVCDSVARFSAGPERASMEPPQSGVFTLYSGCDPARTIWTPPRSRTPPTYARTNIVGPGGAMSIIVIDFQRTCTRSVAGLHLGACAATRHPPSHPPSRSPGTTPEPKHRLAPFTQGHVVSLTVAMSFQPRKRRKKNKGKKDREE